MNDIMQRWIGYSLWLASVIWLNPIAGWAQLPPGKDTQERGKDTPNQTTAKTIDLKVGDVLRVIVPELPPNPAGKIAIFLGNTDITSQVEIAGNELVYKSNFTPLPIGEQTLTVYQIESADRWETIASIRIKVEPAVATSPTDKPEEKPADKPTKPADIFTPKFTINLKSLLAEYRTPDAASAPRSSLLNIDFTGGLSTEHQIDRTNLKTRFNVVATTFQAEAFRFKELQGRAPQIDLTEYAIEADDGNNRFSLGNLCFGNHPFLLSNVCTRGLSAKVKINEFSDLSAARMSSTAIVGFDNILGFGRSENSLDSIMLGLQLAKNQKDGVRLETTWMNGSRAPEPSFEVGQVVDAEQSEGLGVRLFGGDDTGRFKADAGFVNSTFTNPTARDPQLTGGENVIALQSVNKNAWYAEATYELLKDIQIDRNRQLTAAVNIRTERIDPQFGTLGASVQADRLQTQYALILDLGGARAQFQQNFSEDNLAGLPNLLRTNNRNSNLTLNLPLQTFLKIQNPFLPNITYGLQQTQQLGSIAAAAAGGFNDPSQTPNQFNLSHQLGLDWNIGDALTLNYKFINAFQDNNQVGRETADTRTFTHQLSTNWQVNPQFRLNLGYNFVNANNLEQQITRFTNSPTLGLSWEFIPSVLFAFNYNRNDDNDSIGQAFNRGESLECLLTWNFKLNSLGREFPSSVFLRYGQQSNLNQNATNNINTNATIQSISTGLSLSF